MPRDMTGTRAKEETDHFMSSLITDSFL